VGQILRIPFEYLDDVFSFPKYLGVIAGSVFGEWLPFWELSSKWIIGPTLALAGGGPLLHPTESFADARTKGFRVLSIVALLFIPD
jgi:hypothetical protein